MDLGHPSPAATRRTSIPTVDLEPTVCAAAAGDPAAWRDLWLSVEPALFRLVRKRHFGKRSIRDDDCRDVVVAIMARLHADQFHRLRGYLARHEALPELTFLRWLVVVAKRVAIDCMRAHPDYVDARRSRTRQAGWIRTEPLPEGGAIVDAQPRATIELTARQILRYADETLSPLQRKALALWVGQHSLDEIAAALGLGGADDAQRHVHAALARLRRRFRRD